MNARIQAPGPERKPDTAAAAAAGALFPQAGLTFYCDVDYRPGNEKWKLDLLLPDPAARRPLAAIVVVHGGGWVGGDKLREAFFRMALTFAGDGYAVININYRLSGEAPFPAAVEDVKCAVRWLRAHAGALNVDPGRIGAFGISAGGHLAAMLGLAGPGANLEGDGPYQGLSSGVQAVADVCGPTDFFAAFQPGFPTAEPSAFSGFLAGPDSDREERRRAASPVHWAHRGAPPFLVIHGTDDRLVPSAQSESLVNRLNELGAADVTFLRLEGAGHGVWEERAEIALPAVLSFFRRTLKPL